MTRIRRCRIYSCQMLFSFGMHCRTLLGIEEELVFDQSRESGFCVCIILPEAFSELHRCWPKLVVIVWCG